MTVSVWAFVTREASSTQPGDSEFLQSLVWEKSAPKPLRLAAATGEPATFLKAWKDFTGGSAGGRKQPGWTSLWSLPAFPASADLPRLLNTLAPTPRTTAGGKKTAIKSATDWPRRLQPLLDRLARVDVDLPTVLAAAEFWATRVATLPAAVAFPYWRSLLVAFRRVLATPAEDTACDVQLVRSGELPYVAGTLFPGLSGSAALLREGRKFLLRQLNDRTDSDGTPHAELLARLPLWLAPLVRATWWSAQFEAPLWNEDQRQLLSDVITRAAPLCRLNGRLAMGNGLVIDAHPLLTAAAGLLGLSSDDAAASYLHAVARAGAGKSVKVRAASSDADVPSTQSDWARYALLRTDWSPQADTLAIAHHQEFPRIDAAALGHPLLHGDWTLQLQIGDSQLEPAEEWSCVCWVSDADVDYLELQMEGPGNLRVERLVLLSRRDHFLLMADSISGAPKQRIVHRARFPLAAGVTAEADTTTREIRLQSGKQKIRAFPLSLACERVQSTPHSFVIEDNQLVLEQVSPGVGLVAPVVFQWSPELSRKDAVWRTLTVSEDLKVAAPGTAAGFRLRIADSQWLFYRSLKKPKEARTVLGYHTWVETVVARFSPTGDVDPLLMVD